VSHSNRSWRGGWHGDTAAFEPRRVQWLNPRIPSDSSFRLRAGQYNIQVESGQYNVAGGDAAHTPEQRGLLQRAIERVLTALHFTEVVVEVAPDGTIRVGVRSRS
jgi:hypothetical protein